MSDKKNNIFMYSPGGYGPYSRIYVWADHIDFEGEEGDDDYQEAVDEYLDQQPSVDYGFYYMNREECEKLVKGLQKLLEE